MNNSFYKISRNKNRFDPNDNSNQYDIESLSYLFVLIQAEVCNIVIFMLPNINVKLVINCDT